MWCFSLQFAPVSIHLFFAVSSLPAKVRIGVVIVRALYCIAMRKSGSKPLGTLGGGLEEGQGGWLGAYVASRLSVPRFLSKP